MADVSVRPARAAEAAEIARIQRDTLAMAYERLLPPEVFGQLADPQVQLELAEQIRAEIVRPSGQVLVAMEGDKMVGFSFVRAAVVEGESSLEPDDTDVEHTGYLEQMLVEPRFGRRGHGSRLLAASVDFFTTAGFVRAVTWLPEDSEASINFLSSAGWARDGYTRGFDANGTPVREIRLHTAL
ncbi:MAG: family N-acetyltransferase [Pseudonocardiales bacterium]|nr:family N-acetyltransferase [Pseudonocardiales bacterium]